MHTASVRNGRSVDPRPLPERAFPAALRDCYAAPAWVAETVDPAVEAYDEITATIRGTLHPAE